MSLFKRPATGTWGDLEFALDTKAALVDGPSPRSRILLYTCAAFMVCMIVWASLAIIDETTHADGRVIPSTKVQVIQNLEGGILKAIFVKEGQVVNKGEVLVRIDDTTFAASFGEVVTRKWQLLAETTRLRAEYEGIPFVVPENFPQEHMAIVDGQMDLYDARQQELQSAIYPSCATRRIRR